MAGPARAAVSWKDCGSSDGASLGVLNGSAATFSGGDHILTLTQIPASLPLWLPPPLPHPPSPHPPSRTPPLLPRSRER
jgi:hypothetical protein